MNNLASHNEDVTYKYMVFLQKFSNNEDVMKGYITILQLNGKKEKTIKNKLWILVPFFQHIGNKKAELITRTDVESFILKKQKLKTSTRNMHITNLKTFISYLNENNLKFHKKNKGEDFFKNIKLNKHTRDTSEKSYITRSDIDAFLPHYKSQQDLCMIELLWDSAARIGEILNLNVQDVKLGEKSGSIRVTGKTGTRDVVISSSVPDLTLYLNKYNGKGSDPLFPSKNGGLAVRSAQNILAILVKKSGIKTEGKKVNIHSIRHGRLTELAKRKVPEMHLREFAGWTKNSDMPATYIHPTKKDIKLSILGADGISPEEAEEVPEIEIDMKPTTCKRCNKQNPYYSKRCNYCNLTFDINLAFEEDEAEKIAKEQEKQTWKSEAMSDFKKMLDDALAANDQKKIELYPLQIVW
jgi:integrase/recombinase XerD